MHRSVLFAAGFVAFHALAVSIVVGAAEGPLRREMLTPSSSLGPSNALIADEYPAQRCSHISAQRSTTVTALPELEARELNSGAGFVFGPVVGALPVPAEQLRELAAAVKFNFDAGNGLLGGAPDPALVLFPGVGLGVATLLWLHWQ